ncbi:MAG: Rrf2 family transcriptional regulator [Phycisphaerae bacterium]
MLISQKCQYGLRALFELARRGSAEPVSVAEIAESQAIPPRFLEIILGQLKQAGYVVSRRGPQGGYLLARDPAQVTVGEVIQAVQGEIGPVHCLVDAGPECPLFGDCVFYPMWERARAALSGVFDDTTFADLVEHEKRRGAAAAADPA